MSNLPDETVSSPLARPGMTLAGRYTLTAPLGRGGMGEVWRARDTRLERDVAVKLPAAGRLDTQGRERLLREARVAASLNHPGIVAVYDAGEHEGQPYIVMELVEGRSLRERRPDEATGARGVATQVLSALAHVHAGGIVHRDLKPENLLWSTPAPDARLKLADLGIARLNDVPTLTQAGAIVGTAAYLAPEQALGTAVDGRTDLYSLGVVLYELVAGCPPFEGDNALAVISQHVHAPPPPLSLHVAGVDPGFERFTLRLLQKQPEQRFATADEALAFLQAGAGEGADAAPASTLLDQLVRGRLVGRATELERLRAVWLASQGERAQLALVSGEPGVGKSRLARELVVAARVEGAAVISGGCYEFEATTPYLPFVEAISSWARGRTSDALRAALGDSAPDLARLVPELARLGPFPAPLSLAPHEERLRLFEAITRFLRSLAARRGLLVFLDDLHWADSGTVSLVSYLLRQLRDDRVLLLGTYREVELDRRHPLAAALVEWDRERISTRVALDRLGREETDALLATLLGQTSITEEFGAALHHETEGNPFFVEEVVKSLIDQGQIYREGGEWQRRSIEELAIPQSVKSAIGRRLDRLATTCTDALRLAAVLGKTFAFADLKACSDAGEDALLDALDEAVAAQLVLAREDESFVFTHDKIREVLYEELSPIRRRRAHHRIAERLEGRPEARAEDLAYHFLHSGDNERALKWTVAAAERAGSVWALEEAVSYYERARECADALGNRAMRLDVLLRLAGVHSNRGDLSHTLATCEAALPLCATADERVSVNVLAGEIAVRHGDERAGPFLEAASAEVDPGRHAREYVRVQSCIARMHHYRGEHRRAAELLLPLVELPIVRTDTSAAMLVYAYLAGAYQHLSLFETSMKWAGEALEMGLRTGDLALQSVGHEFDAEDLGVMGRYRESLGHGMEDHRLGMRMGSLDRQAWGFFCIGFARSGLGDLAGAATSLEDGWRMADQLGDRRLQCLIASVAAPVAAMRGDDARADEILAEGDALATRLGQTHMTSEVWHGRGRVALVRGDGESALAAVRESFRLKAEAEGTQNRHMYLALAARAAALLGDHTTAEDMARQSIAFCDEMRLQSGQCQAHRALAAVATGRGDIETALAEFGEAVRAAERCEAKLELAETLYERSRVLRAAGRTGEAGADDARARALAVECGAARLLRALDAS